MNWLRVSIEKLYVNLGYANATKVSVSGSPELVQYGPELGVVYRALVCEFNFILPILL